MQNIVQFTMRNCYEKWRFKKFYKIAFIPDVRYKRRRDLFLYITRFIYNEAHGIYSANITDNWTFIEADR